MRVVIAPAMVGDRICRVVSPVASLLEVEEWVGEWWEPSVIPLTMVSLAPAASDDVLEARGVPQEDRAASEPRPAPDDIEASLMTHDPARAADMQFDDAVRRGTGPRRRTYPGNARFRRDARRGTATEDDRRRELPMEWHGPWRRATDPKPPDTAA